MRISRPDFDKPHRCPGWSGGGTKVRTNEVSRCPSGHLIEPDGSWAEPRDHPWRFYRCSSCDIIVLPWVVRYVSPGWWRWRIKRLRWAIEDYWYRARHWRD